MKQDKYKQLIWDYNLTLNDFKMILFGEKKIGSFDQDWAISRALENLNYYDAMDLVPYEVLKNRWNQVKRKIFNKSIKDGYDFLLQRYPVSITG